MKRVVVASAVRTPIGAYGGALRSYSAVSLAGFGLNNVIREAEIDPGMVDDVILGHVYQDLGRSNSARTALLDAGWPVTVPGITLDRRCCSGLDAVLMAVMKIQTGNADIIVAGGMESMSQAVPFNHAEAPAALSVTAVDAAARIKGITRLQADEWAFKSYEKARNFIAGCQFDHELVNLGKGNKGLEADICQRDELSAPIITLPYLGGLKPFLADGISTAGNCAQAGDGAAVLVLMSEEKAHKLGIYPLVYFRSSALTAMGFDHAVSAATTAVGKALKLANLRIDDIDLIDIQELYAAQALVNIDDLGLSADIINQRVNVNGSSIALGHPLAATGTICMVSLIHEVKRRRANFALQMLSGAGGQGLCIILEGSGL